MPGVMCGFGGGVSDNESSCTAQTQSGNSGMTSAHHPTPLGGSELYSFLPGGAQAPQVKSGGIPGGCNQPDQPPGSLIALPCARCHGGPILGQPALPLLQ